MKLTKIWIALPALAFTLGCQSGSMKPMDEQAKVGEKSGSASMEAAQNEKIDSSKVNDIVKGWPARPKLAVQEMMVKYGAPTEASANRVIWMNAGPYKRIEAFRTEVPHDFPAPHMDFLRHTVAYNVPIEKIDDLTQFDASMTFDKTAGEMSAKCDLEGHNILTLNLAQDIILGKKSVAEARKSFAQNVQDDQMGKKPEYVETLLVKAQQNTAFADMSNIPGAAMRATANDKAKGTDAEVMAFVMAVDGNEILASAQAQKKDIGKDVKDYAVMLQKMHSQNQAKVMKLGKQIDQTPADTKAVDDLKSKGASDLAALVPLNGKDFEQAFVSSMIKNHQEVLSLIDNQLLKEADNAQLRKSLVATRSEVAGHLEEAKNLQ